jgi:hypothetical protein
LEFDAVFGRAIERDFDAVVVVERDAEAGAEFAEFFFVEFFLLVRDVFAFAGLAEAVDFDGAGEDDRRSTLVIDGGFVCGVDFARVVAAEAEAAEGLVGKRFDERQEARIGTEELFTNVGAGRDDQFLIFAVDHFTHAFYEQALGVAFEDGIPLATPKDFDDVPARAAEGGLEFLNDLAVAADGAVEALEIAVDDENQIVEFFARGEGDGAEGFGFVGFAVAEEGPDFGVGGRPDRWPSAGLGPWRRWEIPRNRALARDADKS